MLPHTALLALLLAQDPIIWRFDNLEKIGGHSVTSLGHPRVVKNAIEFDGVDDAIVIDTHPLAGSQQYTWEAIFRPDGGQAEQRWFHLQEEGSQNRMLFEIRVIDGQWCLDAFEMSGSSSKALLDRTKLHPLGAWYHVAAVYDGKQFRSYVNGVLQGSADVTFAPQSAGKTAVGMRMNRVYYFKGAVRLARFTRRALPPTEFLSTTP